MVRISSLPRPAYYSYGSIKAGNTGLPNKNFSVFAGENHGLAKGKLFY